MPVFCSVFGRLPPPPHIHTPGLPPLQVFRGVSMLLFIGYPSVSMKLFNLFKCREVEGVYYLAADMRLVCFDRVWVAYAAYGIGMIGLYVVGLPVAMFVMLFRRRGSLFGENSTETAARFVLVSACCSCASFWRADCGEPCAPPPLPACGLPNEFRLCPPPLSWCVVHCRIQCPLLLVCGLQTCSLGRYGFMYAEYGPNAWWWESEELVRKMLLTSVAVLMDAGSPLQVSCAARFCPHPRRPHSMPIVLLLRSFLGATDHTVTVMLNSIRARHSTVSRVQALASFLPLTTPFPPRRSPSQS